MREVTEFRRKDGGILIITTQGTEFVPPEWVAEFIRRVDAIEDVVAITIHRDRASDEIVDIEVVPVRN